MAVSVTRPCICDNFLLGQAYVEQRDCPQCWMFAHRPAVRQAWGGDPADCDAHYAGRRTMTAVELAEVLAGPPRLMPEDWRTWPLTREAHLLLAQRWIADMPPYPAGRFAGRGAVICGGGNYEAGAYVACCMLRHVGWRHPIQVWHRGPAEPLSQRVRRLPSVEVVDLEAHPVRAARRIMGGWESKMFAVLNCPFEEVLYLDADAYPICDPEICFDPLHNPHGIVTWPDGPAGDHAPQWASYGLEPDGQTAINGGHYVLTKRQAWPVLQLAQHYDDHSDYYYCQNPQCVDDVGGFGDQDQFRAALHKLRASSHRYTQRPLACAFESYLQAGPHGRPLFVHRHNNKFALPGQFQDPPRWHPGNLPMEATAWSYFLHWLREPAEGEYFPDSIQGCFTRAECRLWSRMCEQRDVLELGRHHGRSIVVAALAGRSVVSIDPESDGPADLWLQRFGVRHKVWLRVGPFAALAPTSGGPFSACLIDGSHDRAGIEADIAVALPCLAPAAIVGFHDYGDPDHPEVRIAADAAAQHYGWQLVDRADYLAVFALGPPRPACGERPRG
jgi:hypothetical protein